MARLPVSTGFPPPLQRNFDHISGLLVQQGHGSPNGEVIARPGALYVDLDGGANLTLYVKESGIGTNTGWVAK